LRQRVEEEVEVVEVTDHPPIDEVVHMVDMVATAIDMVAMAIDMVVVTIVVEMVLLL